MKILISERENRSQHEIRSLSNFTYDEEGLDRGRPIRDKVILVVDLLNNEQGLQQERTEAFEYRKKFYPGTGPSAEQVGLGQSLGIQ